MKLKLFQRIKVFVFRGFAVMFFLYCFIGCVGNKDRGGDSNTMPTTDNVTDKVTEKTPGVVRKPRDNNPNIVVILTDDQGYGDIGYNGNKHLETPRIDEAAGQSVQFDYFYSNPVCAPTRASLMTGRNFLRTGVWGVNFGQFYMDLGERTLPELMRSAGYVTGMAGKWHLGETMQWHPFNRGFDDAWSLVLRHQHQNAQINYNGQIYNNTGWTNDILTNLAIDFAKQNKDKPFFFYLAYPDPHGKWECPNSYLQKYKSKGMSDRLATFYGMIEHMDYNIGRFLDALDEMQLAEDTIVMFMSDNGPTVESGSYLGAMTDDEWLSRNPANLRGRKGSVWENGIRVPCFIRWSGHFKPALVKQITHVTDILPTIADIAKIEIPKDWPQIDGKSFLPLLDGDNNSWSERMTFSVSPISPKVTLKNGEKLRNDKSKVLFENQCFAVHMDPFKLVKNAKEYELFNIKEDPSETTNISVQNPDVVEKLKKVMEEQFEIIKNSDVSYTFPIFSIGTPQEPIISIPTDVAVRIAGNVKMGNTYTIGWSAVGDAQTVQVNVVQSGKYKLSLEGEFAAEGATVEVSIGNQKLSAATKVGNRLELGEIQLNEGLADLTVKLVKVPGNKGIVIKRLDSITVSRIQ